MNRFYAMVAILAVVLGIAVFALLRTGGTAPAAAAGAPPTVVDDGFRGYTLGQGTAPVEITEYLDFECPVCASFATIQMPTIKEQLLNTGRVRWRYRDYPLPIHKYSRFAAHAAQEGDSMRVDGTPTFFANGKKLEFRRLPGSDDFKVIVDSVIAHSPPKPKPR